MPAAQRGLEESLRKATTFATGTMQQSPLAATIFILLLNKNTTILFTTSLVVEPGEGGGFQNGTLTAQTFSPLK